MQDSPQHYSEIIHYELSERVKKNPNYSLRAFARDLGISAASLSLILKKKTGVTLKRAKSIAKKIELTSEEENFFCDLMQSSYARSKEERRMAKARLCRYETRYNSLTSDLFNVIKDWYHLAIMELTLVKGFEAHPEWIAKKLGITPEEADEGLQRLQRLEIVEMKDGQLVPSKDYLIVLSQVPSSAVKHFQTQILKKISDSFDLVERPSRNIATSIIRMRSSDMDHVKEILKKTRRDIASYAQEGDSHDGVYCLTTSIFRLDQEV